VKKLLFISFYFSIINLCPAQQSKFDLLANISSSKQKIENINLKAQGSNDAVTTDLRGRIKKVRDEIDSLEIIVKFLSDSSNNIKDIKDIVIPKLESSFKDIFMTIDELTNELNNSLIEYWKGQVHENRPNELDIYFVTFNPDKKSPETKYYQNSQAINKMYDDYNAKRLPMRISDEGKTEAIVSCDDILNVGICIPLSRYTTLTLGSALRIIGDDTSASLDKFIEEFVSGAKGKTTGLVFIRLSDLLKEAYYEEKNEGTIKRKSEEECCADEKQIPRDNELKAKLCSILRTTDGLTVKTVGSTLINEVHIRSFGLSAEDLSNGAKVSKIEPRQYVTIYEKENLGSNSNPIWWLLKKPDDLISKKYPEIAYFDPSLFEKFYPVQEYKVVDSKSIVEVRFDQEMLASNIDFYGNISLAASIGGKPIEISPYSMIGKPQKSYGVNSKPVKEIASHFLNLMISVEKVINLQDSIMTFLEETERLSIDKEAWYRKARLEILEKVNEIEQSLIFNSDDYLPIDLFQFLSKEMKVTLDSLGDSSDLLKRLAKDIKKGDSNVFAFSQSSLVSAEELKSELEKFENDSEVMSLKESIDDEIERYNRHILEYEIPYSIEEIRRYLKEPLEEKYETPDSKGEVKNYVDQIRDLIRSDSLKEKLESYEVYSESYSDFDFVKRQNDRSIKKEKSRNDDYTRYKYKIQACRMFMEYFNASGSESKEAFLSISQLTKTEFESLFEPFKKLVLGMPKENLEIIRNDATKRNLLINSMSELKNYLQTLRLGAVVVEQMIPKKSENQENRLQDLLNDSDQYSYIQNEIAQQAGQQLFNRMLYATIDLNDIVVEKEGEILEVKVMWYNIDPNTPNAEEGIELSTAKFLIKKTGWHREPSESVLLIQRLNEDLVTVDVSPSNFKPTAGASLLWTYHNDYRGTTRPGRFLRWLEPSFGLNVSWLDFDSRETFEVGAGPIIGFWGNRLFFTGGYNFNVAGQSPFYIGIGFSFKNVVQKIKEGGSLNE
jgi:ribosomal protein S20